MGLCLVGAGGNPCAACPCLARGVWGVQESLRQNINLVSTVRGLTRVGKVTVLYRIASICRIIVCTRKCMCYSNASKESHLYSQEYVKIYKVEKKKRQTAWATPPPSPGGHDSVCRRWQCPQPSHLPSQPGPRGAPSLMPLTLHLTHFLGAEATDV